MPTENRSSNIPRNLNTAEGGRGYIADLFRNRLGTYSYDRYITERLAADFSCALAAWLDPLLKKLDFLESREATPADGLSVELYAVTLERDILLMQVAEREALLEKVLANAERGLPPDLHRE
ncbi:MAG: hypothetical protein RSE44_29275, partial [Pseudomonas sp.]